jgi:formylglycine-generating enzyme required for sulfatase activity
MFRQVSTVVLVLVAVGSLTVVAAEERKEVGSTTKSLPKELTIDLGKGVKLEMVLIPAGEFLMGSPDSDKDARDSEKPQHRVRITKPFYFGKYPVTQEQWEAVMGNHRSLFKGPKNPVETVGWDDCQQFLAKLNSKSSTQGGKFQLPSEAQWEYACRAGSTTKYYFGDDANRLEDYVHSGRGTYPVGEKKPNAWGLYDMCGNVFEWCQDWYHAGYYVKSPPDDPTGPETRTRPSPVAIFPKDKPTDRTVAPYTFYPMGTDHVIRGCGDMGNGTDYRSAVRSHSGGGFGFLGLRVALIPADKVSTAAEPTPAPPQPITNSIGMKLTLVPSGEFMMGSKESAEETAAFFNKIIGPHLKLQADVFNDEHPQHRVRITRPFYLGT